MELYHIPDGICIDIESDFPMDRGEEKNVIIHIDKKEV